MRSARLTAHARRRAAQMRLGRARVLAILDTASHSFPGRPTSHGTPTTMWSSRADPGYLVCTTRARCGTLLVVTVLFDCRRRYRRAGAGYVLAGGRRRT